MPTDRADTTSPATRVGAGDPAPGFTLPGSDGTAAGRREYSLAEYRGQPVVLVFYPADNTPVCTVQLGAYSERVRSLDLGGAQVLGFSPQSVESHDEFSAAQGGYAFPLLADTDKAVGASYGILGPLGFYRRSVFVIDAAGVIRFVHRSITSLMYQPAELIAAEVRKLG